MAKAFERQIEAFKASWEGDLGQVPLERAVRAHLKFFEALRSYGHTWQTIARALDAAGFRGAGGKRLDGRYWSAVYSRAGRRKPEAKSVSREDPRAVDLSALSLPHSAEAMPTKSQQVPDKPTVRPAEKLVPLDAVKSKIDQAMAARRRR